MKKICKIMCLVIILTIALIGIQGEYSLSNAASASSAISSMKSQTSSSLDTSEITKIGGRILGFIQIVSAVLTVIVIASTGLKYITESAEGKKDVKQQMTPIVIGVVLVFMATSIAGFIVGLFEN